MDLATFSSCIIFPKKMLLNSSHLQPQNKIIYKPLLHRMSFSKDMHQTTCISSITHSSQFSLRNKPSRMYTWVVQSSRSNPEDDHRAMETVLKLYTAIKNKNVNDLSDVIGEECLCFCNFVSSFQPFRGKEQVVAFFSSLMARLGDNMEFVVQPIFQDGLNVGVSWKLEWKESRIPIGKGFSFYMCHVYQGKVIIKNVEMLLEPILHLEPIRLKLVTSLASAFDNTISQAESKCMEVISKLKILFIFLLLLGALISLFR